MLLRDQSMSSGWATAVDTAANRSSDVILLLCRVAMAALFRFSVQGKLANMEGFVANGLTMRGVPGGMAMGYLAVTVEIVGALALLFGFCTRYAALLLAVFVLAATFISHRYWDAPPAQARNQVNHFYKNVSIIAGYLLLFLTGPGRYSLDHLFDRKT